MTKDEMLDFIDINVTCFNGPMTEFLLNAKQAVLINEINEKVKIKLAEFIMLCCNSNKECSLCKNLVFCDEIFGTLSSPAECNPAEIVKLFELYEINNWRNNDN